MGKEEQLNSFNELEDCQKGSQSLYGIEDLNYENSTPRIMQNQLEEIMKLIFSSFANEIVDEDLEVVQKALVIAHQHYASMGDYDEALKITNLLVENLDKGKCFEISVMNENTNKNLLKENMESKTPTGSWFQFNVAVGLIPNGWEYVLSKIYKI